MIYKVAHAALVASFLCSCIFVSALAIQSLFPQSKICRVSWAEFAVKGLTLILTVVSAILLYAFITFDFRLEYVAGYSSLSLPLFYRVTSFWAGQAGSLLFWAWTVALGGVLFLWVKPYSLLSDGTKSWLWCFYFTIMAFFFMLLITWCDPFLLLPSAPADGNGLNPLLQNPGMVIHPPILFLGYGGFTLPACLALAQTLSGGLGKVGTSLEKEPHWADMCRPFIMVAWLLLTAGIILGAWWAYMELGWGGYWAWDPVENASLLPWLIATAYLHTGIIEYRRKKLQRLNVFMIMLVTISAFFATYLVRSGVVQSLHAFGESGIGVPFIIFTGAMFVGSLLIAFALPVQGKPLEDLFSKEGFLVIVAWLLMALALIILTSTMWPVLMKGLEALKDFLPSFVGTFISQIPTGLTESFYNRVCLPLFALMGLLLIFCPSMRWTGGFTNIRMVLLPVLGAILFASILWYMGMRNPLSIFAVAVSAAAGIGIIMQVAATPSLLKVKTYVAAHGVHIGLLLIFIGVAFSGPYKTKVESVSMQFDQGIQIGAYTLTLKDMYEGEAELLADNTPNFVYQEAEILVFKGGTYHGTLRPQMRKYGTHPNTIFPEISTIPGFGDELYASLMQYTPQTKTAMLTIQILPLVNWLWIGGILMSLMPFLALRRRALPKEE